MLGHSRGLVAAAVVALVASACGTTTHQAQQAKDASASAIAGGSDRAGASSGIAGGSTADSTGAASVGSTPHRGSSAQKQSGAASAAAAAVAGGATDVGVTAQVIKLGFIVVVNNDKVESQFGVKGADFGDAKAQIDAVVNDLNARGGVAGRKIAPVYQTYDSYTADDDDTQYARLCAGFTQDNHVFAVLAPWNAPTSFSACLFKAHTLFLNDGLLQEDDATFAQYKPYLYSGLFSLSRAAAAFADGLWSQGFFDGATKTGIIRFTYPSYERASNNALKPALASHGVKVTDEIPIRRDSGTQNQLADVNAAVLKFAAEGINRVIFLTAAGGTALFFIAQAASQHYSPHYGLASPDAPAVLVQNVPDKSQFSGAMGAGWMPATDVADAQGPPYSPVEKRCLAVHAKYGTSYASRSAATTAFAMCDLVWLFEEVAGRVGPNLTRAAWSATLPSIGKGHATPYTFATEFVANRSDGASAYRPLKFDDGCGCFVYASATRTVS